MNKWLGDTVCDMCGRDVRLRGTWFADGNIPKFSQWALLCQPCTVKLKVKFGVGHGQKYDCKSLEKVEG